MSAKGALQVADAVVRWDEASLSIVVQRSAQGALTVLSVLCVVASISAVAIQGEDGVVLAGIPYAVGVLAMLVRVLARVEDRMRDRIDRFVIESTQGGYREASSFQVRIDGVEIDPKELTAISVRTRAPLEVLVLEQDTRARPLAVFGTLEEAREIQAMIASRLSIPLGGERDDVPLGRDAMARMVLATSMVLVGGFIGWVLVLARYDALGRFVVLWLVTAGALALVRVGIGRRPR